jgi:hypothetical protein
MVKLEKGEVCVFVYVCLCLWEGGSSSEEGDGVQRYLIKVS